MTVIGSKRLDDLADAARSIEGINIAITNSFYNSRINMDRISRRTYRKDCRHG